MSRSCLREFLLHNRDAFADTIIALWTVCAYAPDGVVLDWSVRHVAYIRLHSIQIFEVYVGGY